MEPVRGMKYYILIYIIHIYINRIGTSQKRGYRFLTKLLRNAVLMDAVVHITSRGPSRGLSCMKIYDLVGVTWG